MSRTEPILCTIHYIVDGQEYQYNDDQYLPDIPVEGVIKRLIELIKLQPFLDEPQRGVPTLHTALGAPPLDPSTTLSAAGLVDGSQIWLVITPTYLPTTIHWSAGKSGGKLDLVLPTRLTVSEYINHLLDTFRLRERVDGPMKSLASLHSAADAPALALDQNLLDLKLRANGQLWFKVEPTFLPVTLHWQDAHGEQAKRLFLDVEKMLGEHLAERVRLILAAREAISGPEKCVASLRTTPQGVDLPADQKLRDAQITEDTDLWIVWVPTVAEITLHYPEDQGDAFKALRMALPLNRSISDIIRDVAHEIGLASSRIQLASSQDARPWSAQSTLADHRIRSGDDIWVRAVTPPRPPAPIIIAGVVAVLTVAALILGVGRLLGSTQSPQPTALAEAPTVTLVQSSIPTVPPATAIPTSIPTPTRTIEEQKRFDYALGREAYQNQDWPGATDALKRVYALDPAYLDTAETLAATQYNWAVNTLTSADRATESLTILRETFVYSPTHQLARDLEQKLVLYTDGVSATETQDWETATRYFEQLRGISPDFLDVAQQLYDAYMAISNQRREANNSTDALASCRLAADLSSVDTSSAQECIVALAPTPTPVPTRQPTPTRAPGYLYVYLRDRDPTKPTCLSVKIRGTNSAGWYFKVDGLPYLGDFQGGDAANCDLQPGQQVTFTIFDSRGNAVRTSPRGDRGGIVAKGSDIFYADWIQP